MVGMAKSSKNCLCLLLSIFMALALQMPLFIVLMYVLQSSLMVGSGMNSVSDVLGLQGSNPYSTPSSYGDAVAPTTEQQALISPPPPPPFLIQQQQQHHAEESFTPLQPHGMAHYAFVEMNAYRASPRSFFIVGITSVLLRKAAPPVYTCEWHPNNATHDLQEPLQDETHFNTTQANMLYISYDENGELYVPAIVNCTFDGDVGANGYGGILAISVFVGGRYIKETRVVAKKEKRGEVEEVLNTTPKYEYAYCSPPIFHCDRPHWFIQWLTYHHYVFEGKAHFFFYNVGGLTQEARMAMAPFLDAGLLTIIEAQEQRQYISWYYNQLLFINDCLHRSKALAKWVVFHDFDEFLDVQPPRTLNSLLEEYKEMPWITYGSIPASTGHCRLATDEEEWAIERFLCRNEEPECMDKEKDPWNCVSATGRRKYIVRASKVITTGVHSISVPSEGGVNLNASIARVYHYRSALSKNVNPCGMPFDLSKTQPGCFRDDSFAQRSQEARKFASQLLLAPKR